MSRMFQVLVVMVALALSANAAEVVSMKLCETKDYDASTKQCAPGKALEGNGIVIVPEPGKSVSLLTAIKTGNPEDIFHVWIYEGKAPLSKPSYFDSETKTIREADDVDLAWLKERKIEGARAIVKLPVMPSAGYRTRSQRSMGPGAAGPWKVQVYDSTNLTPIGEMRFAVTPSDKGISE